MKLNLEKYRDMNKSNYKSFIDIYKEKRKKIISRND